MKLLRKRILLVLIPVLLIAAGIIGTFLYQSRTVKMVQQQSYALLQETVSKQSYSVLTTVEEQTSILKAFAALLGTQQELSIETIVSRLNVATGTSGFMRIFYADLAGNAYSNDGLTVNVADRQYFRTALGGLTAVERVPSGKLITGPRYIIAVPIMVDDQVTGVIYGSYDEASFCSLVLPSSSGYSFIVSKDGSLVLADKESSNLLQGKNVLTLFNTDLLKKQMAPGTLRDALFSGRSGMLTYHYGTTDYYAVYCPIGINGWTLFSITPSSHVEGAAREIMYSGRLLLSVMFAILFSAIVVLVGALRRQLHYVALEEDLRNQVSLYRSTRIGGVFSMHIDEGLTLLYGNDKFFQIIGYSENDFRKELRGKCLSCILPEDRDMVIGAIHTAQAKLEARMECTARVISTNGEIKDILMDCQFETRDGMALLNGVALDVTEQKRTERALEDEKEALQLSEERFHIALENTSVSIWEYDIATLTLIQGLRSQSIHGFDEVLTNVPESLIKSGFVSPESVEDYRSLYEKLSSGVKKAEGIFHVQNAERTGYWYEYIRYTVIMNAEGKPVKAIGVSEDVSERVEAVRRYETESSLRRTIVKDAFASAILNLDSNVLESIDVKDPTLQEAAASMSPDALLACLAKYVKADDPSYEMLSELSPSALKKDYRAGRETVSFEFEGSFASGAYRWYSFELRLLKNPTNKALYAFLYLRDIDDAKREKEALEKQAHTDSLTGILNVSTAREKINHYIKSDPAQQLNAFFMIDLDNFKEVNDQLSHFEGDRVLVDVANELCSQFRDTDVVARIGGDEFIVFMHNIPSNQFARTKAEVLCHSLQFTHTNGEVSVHISCSIGVVLCRGDKKDYEQLYVEADDALYQSKNAGKSRFCMLDERSEEVVGEGRALSVLSPVTARNNTIQLSALLQYMEGGILLIEICEPMQILYVSPSYYSSTGIALSSGPKSFMDFLGLIHEQDKNGIVESLRRGSDAQTAVDITYRIQLPSGEIGWHHMRAVHIPYQGTLHPVMIAVVTDITEWQRSAEQLSEDRKKLALALEQTDLRIWNYDRQSKSLWTDGDANSVVIDMPESLIRDHRIHPDSVPKIREFFRLMDSDARSGHVVIKTSHLTEDYTWLSVSFVSIFDSDGLWQKTIGVTHRLPYIDTQLACLEQESYLQKALEAHLIATARINLSTRTIEEMLPADKKHFDFSSVDGDTYDSIARFVESLVVEPLDLQILQKRFATEALIDAYENGRQWITTEFRAKTKDGKIRWVAVSVNLLSDPVSGQLLGFGYLRCVDARKRWEITLNRKVEFDSRTGLYDSKTTEAMATHLLDAFCGSRKDCGLAILKIDGLQGVFDNLGYSTAGNVLFTVGRVCSISMDYCCVAGSYSDDRIVFFLPDLSSEDPAFHPFQSLLTTLQGLRHKVYPNLDLHFLLGYAMCPCANASYEKLCKCADEAIARIGCLPIGQDTAYLMDSSLLEAKDPAAETAEGGVAPGNSESDLDEHAHTLLNECMRRIILSSSAADCAHRLLPLLGGFYHADRVFTLLVSGDQQYVSMGDEWCAPGVDSLAEKFSNTAARRFPAISEAIQNHTVVGTTACASCDRPLIAAPIRADSKVEGLICIDTPTAQQENLPVLSLISDYWRQAYSGKAFSSSSGIAYFLDPMTGLFNRNKYSAHIATCPIGELSSLGIASADLNGLSNINSQLGSAYGDRMILFAAQCFEQAFGRESVYRISGDEFVAMLEDVTCEHFGKCCDLAKSLFEESYPNGLSIGYAWADADIKIKSMEEHARSIMKLCKQDYYEMQMNIGTLQRPEVLTQLQKDLAEGRYQMYLQPKIRISDGSICGAEALVRYNDSERGLVAPIGFISAFETQNIIRHIDLFILEEAARTLHRWQEDGKPLIPIAVNFSRKTFLDRTVLQRSSDIIRQYHIPLTMLEIEIAESVADVERATLAEFCRRYKEKGFRLALDDFGSEYSSLSVLASIRFDVLKMDKSLINDITCNSTSRIIAQNTVSLCKQIHIVTVAEGVETAEQLTLLKKMGCDIGQGYLFNQPLPLEQFEKNYSTRQRISSLLPDNGV